MTVKNNSYEDLYAAFGDNWDAYVNHYFEYGIKEGRDNGTDFDIIRYVNSYADLREAFDEDYEALAKHYIKYGMKENRTKALKEPEYIPFGSIYERDAYDRITKEWYYATDFSGELLEYIVYEYSNNGTTRTRKYRDNSYQISTSWIDGSGETKKYRADGTLEFYFVRHIDGTYTYTQYDENGNPI